MMIGLTGLAKSGKDTVGAYLMKEHEFQRIALADAGKRLAELVLDIPHWDAEKFKNDPSVFVAVGYKNQPEPPSSFSEHDKELWQKQTPSQMWSPISELSYRHYLQRLLNNACKEVFGDDVWTNIALPVGGFYTGRKIVVTDVRFNVEANRIKELGGKIVRIIRDEVAVNDTHISEIELQDIKPNYILYNNGSMEELFNHTEAMLGWACA